MKFDYRAKTYDFNDDSILLSEFRYIKKTMGLSSGDVITGLLRMDAEALAAAVLLSAKRAGEPLKPEDLDDLDVIALINSIAKHRDAAISEGEDAAADEPGEAKSEEDTPAEPEPEPEPATPRAPARRRGPKAVA